MSKKRAFFLLSALIILGLNSISLPVAAESPIEGFELLASSNFETATFEGWSAFGNRSRLETCETSSYGGNISLKVTDREKAWSGPSMNVTELVAPSSQLFIRGYAMSGVEQGDNIRVSMKVIDAQGTEDYITAVDAEITGSEWTLIEGALDIPGDFSELIVYVETAGDTNDFYIDDFQLWGIPQGSNVPDAVSKDKNLDNGNYYFGFEDSVDGWIPRGGVDLMSTNKFSYSGKCCLYVSSRQAFWSAPMVRLSNVQPHVDYSYSSYVMYNEKQYEDSHVFVMKLQYILNGEEVYSLIGSKLLQKGTWSKISGHFILPAGATDVFLYIQTDDVNTDEREENINDLISFYVDNVSVIDSTAVNAEKSQAFFIMLIIGIAVIILLVLSAVYLTKRHMARRAALRSASIDAMTGVYNRNFFEKRVEALNDSPDKIKKTFVTICDMNYLKDINDNYGHETGDKAIIRCAAVLMRAAGKKNPVYRTGGDEFIIFSETDISADIRTEFTLESAKYKGYPFSLAIGVSSYDKEADGDAPEIKTLIMRADKEMYKNKQEIKKKELSI